LWLAAVLDLHSRRYVGFAIGIHQDAALARAALCMAIAVRGGAVAGVILHTDQAGEYTATVVNAGARSARNDGMDIPASYPLGSHKSVVRQADVGRLMPETFCGTWLCDAVQPLRSTACRSSGALP
jgi:hypothetical protein